MSLFRFRLRNAWNWGGLSARQLLARTWVAIERHDTLNRAAVVALYAMLSLAPMLGLILAVGLSTHSRVASNVLDLSARFLPADADSVVRDQVQKIQSEAHVGVLSLSAVILLWSASSFFVAVMDTTNAAYGVQDSRPWWKRRALALILRLAEVSLLVVASILALAWPALTDRLKLGEFGWLTSAGAVAAQWFVVVMSLLTAFALAYYFGPDVKHRWEWFTPGAALGVVVLVGASLGFQFYLRFGSSYSETYGALAGVVLMMLWLYLAALALMVGAEVNSVIEHAATHAESVLHRT